MSFLIGFLVFFLSGPRCLQSVFQQPGPERPPSLYLVVVFHQRARRAEWMLSLCPTETQLRQSTLLHSPLWSQLIIFTSWSGNMGTFFLPPRYKSVLWVCGHLIKYGKKHQSLYSTMLPECMRFRWGQLCYLSLGSYAIPLNRLLLSKPDTVLPVLAVLG